MIETKKMTKKDREEYFDQLGNYLPKHDHIKFIKIMDQIESELSDLRIKAYSVEFAKQRAETLSQKEPSFTQFLIQLVGEKE